MQLLAISLVFNKRAEIIFFQFSQLTNGNSKISAMSSKLLTWDIVANFYVSTMTGLVEGGWCTYQEEVTFTNMSDPAMSVKKTSICFIAGHLYSICNDHQLSLDFLQEHVNIGSFLIHCQI